MHVTAQAGKGGGFPSSVPGVAIFPAPRKGPRCTTLQDFALTCTCMRRLVKAGVIPQQYARRFNLVSAWAEMVGYVGSIWLNALRIAAALERERALSEELLRRKKVQPLHLRLFSSERSA